NTCLGITLARDPARRLVVRRCGLVCRGAGPHTALPGPAALGTASAGEDEGPPVRAGHPARVEPLATGLAGAGRRGAAPVGAEAAGPAHRAGRLMGTAQ